MSAQDDFYEMPEPVIVHSARLFDDLKVIAEHVNQLAIDLHEGAPAGQKVVLPEDADVRDAYDNLVSKAIAVETAIRELHLTMAAYAWSCQLDLTAIADAVGCVADQYHVPDNLGDATELLEDLVNNG